jgi:hypothetical protein
VVSIKRRRGLEIAMDWRSVKREVRHGIDRPRRDVRRHAIEKLVRVFAIQDELTVLVPRESLTYLSIDQG